MNLPAKSRLSPSRRGLLAPVNLSLAGSLWEIAVMLLPLVRVARASRWPKIGWLAASFLAITFGAVAMSAEEGADPGLKVVEVGGAGIDVDAAKKDAYREAVRQVVGAYVNSATRTENDELIEDKVVALSSGSVEKAETLKESAKDGLVRVRIRATVRVSEVLDSLKKHNIAVAKIDGESLGARLLTQQDQKAGFAELTNMALKGYPLPCFKASKVGEPRLGEKRDDGNFPLFVTVKIEPDLDEFVKVASKVDKALPATPRLSGSLEVDHALCGWRSQQDASQEINNDMGNREQFATETGAGEKSYPITALSYIDGTKAFPLGFGQEDLQVAGMDGEHCALMFPIQFLGKGRRSSWKWYLLTWREAGELLKPLVNTTIHCRATLCDKQGQPISIKKWGILGLGAGGMQAFSPGFTPHTFVLAPGYVSWRDGARFIVGHFTADIEFILAEEEVAELDNVTVELQ
jgi:hypothetical protein